MSGTLQTLPESQLLYSVPCAKISVVWHIPPLHKADGEVLITKRLFSPPFGRGRWRISVEPKEREDEGPDLRSYLWAIPEEAEYVESNGSQWVRKEAYRSESIFLSASSLFIHKHTFGTRNFAETAVLNAQAWGPIAGPRLSVFLPYAGESIQLKLHLLEVPHPQLTHSVTLSVPSKNLLLACFDNIDLHNVQFTFTQKRGAPKRIHALKILLADSCEYFKDLFSFNDGTGEASTGSTNAPTCTFSARLSQDDSDAESEEETSVPATAKMERSTSMESIRTSANAASTFQEIKIVDFSYQTYYAMLLYLHTGFMSFAPMRSQYEHDKKKSPDSATFASRKDYNSENVTTCNIPDGSEHIHPVSAKSIYRLADKLCLDSLRNVAKQHIISSMTPEIAMEEASSSFSSLFPDIRKEQLAYVKAHKSEISLNQNELWERTQSSPVWFELSQMLMSS